MENTTYIALSKQMTLAQEMNKIAHNMANLNTTGFKSQHLILTEQDMKAKDRDADTLKMVMDYGDYRDMAPGPLNQTGASLDFALEGDGFFAVQNKDNGQTYYTRSGNFSLNAQNEIVMPTGHKILSGGAPIVVPEGISHIEVTKQGVISTEQGEIGKFDVVSFDNDELLQEFGSNLFATNQPAIPATDTSVNQGMLEQSNVQAIVEMTRMIDVSRQYQITQRMIQTEHERMETAIRKLGTVNA